MKIKLNKGYYNIKTKEDEQNIIEMGIKILKNRWINEHEVPYGTEPKEIDSKTAKDLSVLKLADRKNEYLAVMWLDSRNKLLKFEVLFRGSINSSSVHPRGVVMRALEINANAAIICHNHPSGNPTPSSSDLEITEKLRDALQLIEVRLLDHIVVGKLGAHSMAECGQI